MLLACSPILVWTRPAASLLAAAGAGLLALALGRGREPAVPSLWEIQSFVAAETPWTHQVVVAGDEGVRCTAPERVTWEVRERSFVVRSAARGEVVAAYAAEPVDIVREYGFGESLHPITLSRERPWHERA